jgi:hypothetical protein
MPGCYPPPALSNYSSATDLQLKGLFCLVNGHKWPLTAG